MLIQTYQVLDRTRTLESATKHSESLGLRLALQRHIITWRIETSRGRAYRSYTNYKGDMANVDYCQYVI